MTVRILVVDDDPAILAAVRTALHATGHEAVTAGNGDTALETLATTSIDLVLLDLSLPGVDGHEVLRRLRQFSATPVIVMSARDLMAERVQALDEGADDYLTKPFAIEELIARLRAVLRRSADEEVGRAAVNYDGLQIDFARHEVRLEGQVVRLTPTEHRLLEVMAANPGKLLTHAWLLSRVWGPGYGREAHHQLRVFVRQLRSKIGDDPRTPRWIGTEPGLGYRWIAEPRSEAAPAQD